MNKENSIYDHSKTYLITTKDQPEEFVVKPHSLNRGKTHYVKHGCFFDGVRTFIDGENILTIKELENNDSK